MIQTARAYVTQCGSFGFLTRTMFTEAEVESVDVDEIMELANACAYVESEDEILSMLADLSPVRLAVLARIAGMTP